MQLLIIYSGWPGKMSPFAKSCIQHLVLQLQPTFERQQEDSTLLGTVMGASAPEAA